MAINISHKQGLEIAKKLAAAKQKQIEEEKKRLEEEKKKKSGSLVDRMNEALRSTYEKNVGFDTLQSDSDALAKKMEENAKKVQSGAYVNPAETEALLKEAEALKKRYNVYNNYVNLYAPDNAEAIKQAKEIKDGYDGIYNALVDQKNFYGGFKDENEFNAAIEAEKERDRLTNNYDLEANKKILDEKENELNSKKNLTSRFLEAGTSAIDTAANIMPKTNTVLDKVVGAIKNVGTAASAVNDADKGYSELLKEYEKLKAEYDEAKWLQDDVKYASLTESSDFEEQSKKANSGKDYGETARAADYINGKWYAKAGQKVNEVIDFINIFDDNETSQQYQRYDQMTDDQVKTFNYIYNTQGKKKAQEYLDHIEPELQNKYAQKNKSSNFLTNLVRAINSGTESVGEGLEKVGLGALNLVGQGVNAANDLMGVDAPNIPSTDKKVQKIEAPSNTQLSLSAGTKDAGKAEKFVYDLAQSLPQSALSFVPGGAVLQGLSAAGNAYGEATADEKKLIERLAYATGEGLLEYFTEKTFNGVGVSKIDDLAGVAGNAVATKLPLVIQPFADTIVTYGIKAGSEAFEEGFQEIVGTAYKNLIYGENEDVWDWEKIGRSALLGAASASILNSPASVANVVQDFKLPPSTEASFKKNYDTAKEGASNSERLSTFIENFNGDDVVVSTKVIKAVEGGDTQGAIKLINEAISRNNAASLYVRQNFKTDSSSFETRAEQLNKAKKMIQDGSFNAEAAKTALTQSTTVWEVAADANDTAANALLNAGLSNNEIEKKILKDKTTVRAFERLTGVKLNNKQTLSAKRNTVKAVAEAYQAVANNDAVTKATQNLKKNNTIKDATVRSQNRKAAIDGLGAVLTNINAEHTAERNKGTENNDKHKLDVLRYERTIVNNMIGAIQNNRIYTLASLDGTVALNNAAESTIKNAKGKAKAVEIKASETTMFDDVQNAKSKLSQETRDILSAVGQEGQTINGETKVLSTSDVIELAKKSISEKIAEQKEIVNSTDKKVTGEQKKAAKKAIYDLKTELNNLDSYKKLAFAANEELETSMRVAGERDIQRKIAESEALLKKYGVDLKYEIGGVWYTDENGKKYTEEEAKEARLKGKTLTKHTTNAYQSDWGVIIKSALARGSVPVITDKGTVTKKVGYGAGEIRPEKAVDIIIGHELVHFIKRNASGKAKELYKDIIDKLSGTKYDATYELGRRAEGLKVSEDAQQRYDDLKALYVAAVAKNQKISKEQAEGIVTDDYIMEEIAADFMGALLSGRGLYESITRQTGFIGRIAEWIRLLATRYKADGVGRVERANLLASKLDSIVKRTLSGEEKKTAKEIETENRKAEEEASRKNAREAMKAEAKANREALKTPQNEGKTEGEQTPTEETKRADNGDRMMVVGEKAEGIDLSALDRAMRMFEDGEDSENIRKETGWFKGYDDRWKYEIDDSVAEWHLDTAKPDPKRLFEFGERIFKLSDILDHKELYKAYPQLRDVTVWENPNAAEGGYVVGKGTDSFVMKSLANTEINKDLIIHEIQHLVQHIEGFAQGASPNQYTYLEWGDTEYDAYEKRNEVAKKLYAILRRHGVSIKASDMRAVETAFEVDDGIIQDNYITISNLADSNPRTEALLDEYYKYRNILYRTTPHGQYMATAGKIEAYDTQARRRKDADYRKNTRPNIDRTDAIVYGSNNGVSESIAFASDGRPVVVVNDDITRGAKNNAEIKLAVKQAIRKFKRVPIKKQSIYFIGDTANEYTSSQYTKWLERNDREVFMDKMRVGQHPVDIVYATTDYINEGLKHKRKDNIVDFARGKILLDVAGNQYEAEAVIGFTKSGICELHDIVKMQSTTFEYKKDAASEGMDYINESTRSDATSLNGSISQPSQNVNSKFSLSEANADGVVENADGDPVAVDEGNGSTKWSISTYEESGRSTLDKYLKKRVKDNSLTQDDVDDIMNSMDDIYNICKNFEDEYVTFGAWSKAKVEYDKDGKPLFSVVKANGDYKMNLDFSLVCKKRRALDAVFNRLIEMGMINTFDFGQEEIVRINDIIRNHGFEVACALCFVDAKRYRQGKVADDFVEIYNGLVESLDKNGNGIDYFNFGGDSSLEHTKNGIDTLSDGELDFTEINRVIKTEAKESVLKKVAQHLKNHPEDRKLLSRGDFMSSKGFGEVKKQNPAILSLYNSKKGTGGPKASFGDVQYMNEIIGSRTFSPERAFSVGGVRIQSFSDYVARLVFDYVQMVGDLAAKKLPAHAYTKEVLFVKQFGLTGIKINMSLIPEVGNGKYAGLNTDGSYAWASESFPVDEAFKIQEDAEYGRNCGTIAVGVSDEHIRKLLKDPKIRMVIPYHKSGINPIVAHMMKIDGFTDYTNIQNTTHRDGTKISAEESKGMPDFNVLMHKKGMSPVEASRTYVEWCESKGFRPKFPQFAYVIKDGKKVFNENYYKLLEDFTTSFNGETVHQEAVKMRFPDESSAFGSMKDLIQQGLSEDDIATGELDADVDNMVNEIAGVLGGDKMSVTSQEDADYLSAVERGDMKTAQMMVERAADKAMPDSILREGVTINKGEDVEGTLIIMYHGSGAKDFYTFEANDGALGKGVYVTSNWDEAVGYALEKLEIEQNDDGYYVWNGDEYDGIGSIGDALESEGYVRGFYANVTDEQDVSASSVYWEDVIALVRDATQLKSADPVTYDDNGNVIPLSERFNAENEDIRWSVSPSLDSDIDSVLNGTFDASKNEVYLGETSQFMTDVIGANSLALYMPAVKVYSAIVSREEYNQTPRYKKQKHYHGIGKEDFIDILERSENPIAAFADTPDVNGNNRHNRIVLVTDKIVKDAETGEEGYAVVVEEVDATGRSQGKTFKANKAITVYERTHLLSDIQMAIADGRLLAKTKKGEHLLNMRRGANSQATIREDVLKKNIADFWANVKWANEKNKIYSSSTAPATTAMEDAIKNSSYYKSMQDSENGNDDRMSESVEIVEGSTQSYDELVAETKASEKNNVKLVEKLLKEHGKLDGKSVESFLREIIGAYKSEAWFGNVKAKYQEVFDKIYNSKGEVSAEDVAEAFREVAALIFDGTTENELETLVKDIHATEIKVSDDVKAAFGKEWNDFRMKNFGNLALRNDDGRSISEVYSELAAERPELFSDEITDEAEQLKAIADVCTKIRAELKSRVYNEAQANVIESIASDLIQGTMSLDPQVLYSYNKNNKTKEYYKRRIEQLKQAHKDWADKVAESIASKNERQRIAYDKKMAYKRLGELSKALFAPTKDHHIPEDMRNDVAAFFRKVKLPRNTVAEIEFADRIASYIKQSELGTKSDFENLPSSVAGEIKLFTEFDLNSFDADQMHEFSQLVRMLARAINQENKLYHSSKDASEVALSAIRNILVANKDRNIVSKSIGKVADFIGMSVWDPEGLFNYIDIPELYEAYLKITEGQDAYADNLKYFSGKMAEIVNGKIPKEWRENIVDITLENGKTLSFTGTQIMTLYLLNKQADSRKRLLDENGGIQLTKKEIKVGKKPGKYIALSQNTSLTQNDLDKILSKKYLTEDMKKVAEDLSKLLNGDISDRLNEVSLKLDGYKRFGVEDYFPMTVAEMAKQKNGEYDLMGAQYEALKIAKGFTFDRTGTSGVKLVVDDIFKVMDRHILGASQYIGYESALRDFMKIWTGKYNNQQLRDAVNSRMSENVAKAVDKFILGIQGRQMNVGDEHLLSEKLLSNYKAAQVALNLSVVAKQPMSIIRAMPEFSGKGIAAMAKKVSKADTEQMLEYSGLANMKNWGFSENTTARTVGQLYDENALDWRDKMNSFPVFNWAEKADMHTWTRIWNACVAETNSLEEATKKFNEVIRRTQVVDTATTSSPIAKANPFTKIVFAFKNEPLKTFNYTRAAVQDVVRGKKGAAKHLTKVLAANAINTAFVAAITTAFSMMRDEEDDDLDKFFDKLAKNANSDVLDTLFIFAGDILNAVDAGKENRTVERTDLAVITDAVQFIDRIAKGKYGSDGDRTFIQGIYDASAVVSSATGIPIKTVLRSIKTTVQNIVAVADDPKMDYNVEKLFYNVDSDKSQKRFKAILTEALDTDYKKYSYIKNDLVKHGYGQNDIDGAVDNSTRFVDSWNEGADAFRKALNEAQKYDSMLTSEYVIASMKTKRDALVTKYYNALLGGNDKAAETVRGEILAFRSPETKRMTTERELDNLVTDKLERAVKSDVKDMLVAGYGTPQWKISVEDLLEKYQAFDLVTENYIDKVARSVK